MENKIYTVEKRIFKKFEDLFQKAIEGTGFKSSFVVVTEENEQFTKFYIDTPLNEIVDIPGYTFRGTIQFDNDSKFVFGYWDNWHESLANIDPTRCDVCGVRHKRSKVAVLTNDETNDLTVVGGSCARKFKGTDIYSLVSKAISDIDKIVNEITSSEQLIGLKFKLDLAKEIAVGEFLCDKYGYVSKTESIGNNTSSTAEMIYSFVLENMPIETQNSINKRMIELNNSDFSEHKEYFENKFNNERNSSFYHNCWETIKNPSERRFGLVAYISSMKLQKEKEKLQKTIQKEKTKPLDIPLGKMENIGDFKLLSKKETENDFGCYWSVTMINEQNQKIWAKTKYSGYVGKEIKNASIGDTFSVRCKAKTHKDEISFVSHIKFLK